MDVEHDQKASLYKKLFAGAARKLNKDEAHTLSYIYSTADTPPALDTLPMVYHVFRCLAKKGLLTPDDSGMDFLQEMLTGIDRVDIAQDLKRQLKG